jgi:hypothetical protein
LIVQWESKLVDTRKASRVYVSGDDTASEEKGDAQFNRIIVGSSGMSPQIGEARGIALIKILKPPLELQCI